MVCSLIDNDTRQHISQNVVYSRGEVLFVWVSLIGIFFFSLSDRLVRAINRGSYDYFILGASFASMLAIQKIFSSPIFIYLENEEGQQLLIWILVLF